VLTTIIIMRMMVDNAKEIGVPMAKRMWRQVGMLCSFYYYNIPSPTYLLRRLMWRQRKQKSQLLSFQALNR
jgi:hypothetical protein